MNFLLLNTLTSSASMLLNVTCIMLSCNVFTSISLRILSTSTDAEKKKFQDYPLIRIQNNLYATKTLYSVQLTLKQLGQRTILPVQTIIQVYTL